MIRELRDLLNNLLHNKIENPELDLHSDTRGSAIIQTIVTLITSQ